MRRINFKSKSIAFVAGFIMIVINRSLYQVTDYSSDTNQINETIASNTKTENITDLIIAMTRIMVKTEMHNYNFTSSNVNTLEDLLMENGGKPVRSLIISSWRTGASFLGDLLNAMPSTFYNFEPLLIYRSFQVRGQPHDSISTRTVKEMLRCNFYGMGEFYFKNSKKIRKSVNQIQINKRLWDKCSYNEDVLCYSPDFVSKLCKLFPFQTMKTVRYRLHVAEPILRDNELNARVVLLVRDPRAVLRSRNKFCYGADCRNPDRLCADMVKDYQAAAKFSKKYPDKLMVLRYEDLILELNATTDRLLKFLRLGRTPSIDKFLQTHTNVTNTEPFSTFRVSRDIPYKWKKAMSFTEVNKIQVTCQNAMSIWGYVRAHNAAHMKSANFNPLRPYSLN